MSFVAGAWIFVKLSRQFVKTHSWALAKMSMDKLSGLNGGLPGTTKLRKQQESLHVPDSVRKWRIKVLLFWLLGALAIGSFWFLLSFGNGPLRRKQKGPDFFEEKVEVLLQHFNISKNQLHALASLFSESDQIASLECTKEPGPEMQMSNAINCALSLLCSKRQEFRQQGKWKAEHVGPNGQCLVQDEGTFRKLDDTVAYESLTFLSENEISACSHHFGKENMLPSEAGCHCKILSLVIRFWWILIGMIAISVLCFFRLKFWMKQKHKPVQLEPVPMQRQHLLQLKHQPLPPCPPQGAGMWMKKLLILIVFLGILMSIWLFWHLSKKTFLRRRETLANMCDERARMLQDQFNVSMNHVNALAILVSTFHHGKDPSAIDQKTFGEYTERTAFERPLTSGVSYALKVPHSKRQQFEMQHGWTIKKMETEDQSVVQDCIPEKLDPAPTKDEYAPVIFAQETVSHIVSIDMMSGKEDRENILRARASGKGVLTSPFKLLKSNHLGVVLTFAVYKADLPPDATPEQRIEATVGYLGASYDVPSLVEKLLHQLACKQTIVVNVYDTTNASAPILMYGTVVTDTGLLHISHLDFGDPLRKHEMHCRFKRKPPLPWMAINAAVGVLVITLLIGHIFHAAINRITKVEEDYHEMMELKVRAEAADVAKSQFLATVSHEIRTPMNGVLGMLQMLMNTTLDESQMDYAQTAHNSGKDLISLINEVLEQAKIESGRLELEAVPFDLRSVLDEVLSLFSGKSAEKGIELAVYVSKQVPEVVVGDPGRFRQIITNLVGNSIKFTNDKGHIFVSVHLVEEARNPLDVNDLVLKQGLNSVQDMPYQNNNTLSGFPVVNRWKSWENFRKLDMNNMEEDPEIIRLLVTVEDTGVGIPPDAQSRIFTPFMQADSSTSRTYGGTGIGLSISKHLVDLMGGEIGFVSERLTGSAFSFTASFRKVVPSTMDTRQQPNNPAFLEFQGWKALVIDKRSIRAEVTRYHLHRLSINVYTASSLQLASCYLSNGSSASVPADLAMVLIDKDVWNEESGIALQHFLKELKRVGGPKIAANLPKIFLLATTMSPDERSELKSSGLVDYALMKPLHLSMLIDSFQEAFGNGKKNQVNRRKLSSLQNLLTGKQILVVDDNKVNRMVAEGTLKKYGVIVTCVESGKAAIEMLKPPHTFDACFMDRQMPEMDGLEATRQIRAMECQFNEQIESGEASVNGYGNEVSWHTPILAMTADVTQATREECLKCGMDGYVSKPFEEEQLYDAVSPFFESG